MAVYSASLRAGGSGFAVVATVVVAVVAFVVAAVAEMAVVAGSLGLAEAVLCAGPMPERQDESVKMASAAIKSFFGFIAGSFPPNVTAKAYTKIATFCTCLFMNGGEKYTQLTL